ncbi:MAG: DUF4238 domain-containing protein [Thermohalobaculum sp.]
MSLSKQSEPLEIDEMGGGFQHYVPSLLLRNFVGSDGKVNIFDIQSGENGREPVSKIAGETNYYNFPLRAAGGKIAENALQVVESDAARVIRKIIKSKNVKSLSDDHRKKLARFIAIQSFRTKAFFVGLELGGERTSREVVFSELWRSSVAVEKEILNRRWFLMESTAGREYYLGDHPVVLQHVEDPGGGRQLGFGVPGVEAYMPISPLLALYMPPRSVSDEIISGYRNAIELHRQVRLAALGNRDHPFANSADLQTLQRVIYSAKAIHDADAIGTILISTDENIKNFNSLQIMFSEKEIYSRDGNFKFAKEVLSKTPNYAKVVSTNLELIGSLPRAEKEND